MPEESVMALSIPIISIILGIGVAFWAIYWDYRTKQLKYRERELMIEKGLTPPPMLPEKMPMTREGCLRRGIILLFLGIGLGIACFILLRTWEPFAWVCGVGGTIVGFLGIGFLVYYAVARKRLPESPDKMAT